MFFVSKTVHFPIAISLMFYVFVLQTAPGDRFWRVQVPIHYEKCDLGAIFDFHDFQKGTLWNTFSPKQAPKKTPPVSYRNVPCRDPAFHETKVITVTFGSTVF